MSPFRSEVRRSFPRGDETGEEGWRDLTAHDFRRTWATLLAGTDGVDALHVCQWGG